MDNVTPAPALLKARELAELEKWATAAPWIMNDIKPSQYRVGSNATGKALADMRYKNGVHDGRFIAALRNAFPSFLSELERLHAENQKLREGYTGMRKYLERKKHWPEMNDAQELLTSFPSLT